MIHQIKKWMESKHYLYVDKDYALIICAEYGKTEFVRYLLDAGADVHAENDYALRWASYRGHTEVVKLLLDVGADVHANDDEALRWASNNGHTEVVKLLLDAGANVHASNDYALRYASNYGHTEVVKLLLDAGADVHADNDKALRWASNYGHTEVVKLLLDAGADVHVKKDYALRYASLNGHIEVVKLLKDHIAKEKKLKNKIKESLNEKFTEDSDPIKDLNIGMMNQIREFLYTVYNNDGIYVDFEGDNINNFLVICSRYRKLEFVKYLIEAGADVNYKEGDALRWASVRGYTEIVKILLDAGSNVHGFEDQALRISAQNGHTKVVKLLLDAGADVHTQEDEALKQAKFYGHNDIVKILKKYMNKQKNPKIVRESLNEKFTEEDSDPIADMGIGMINQIEKWIKSLGLWHHISMSDTEELLTTCIQHRAKSSFIEYLLKRDNKYNIDNILSYCISYERKEFLDYLINRGAKFKELYQKVLYVRHFKGKLVSFTPEEELIVACKEGDFSLFKKGLKHAKIKIGMINSLFTSDYYYSNTSSSKGKQEILNYLRDNESNLDDIIHPRDIKKIDKIKTLLGIKKSTGQRTYPHGYKIYRILKFIDENVVTSRREITKFIYELSFGTGTFNPLVNSSYWVDGFSIIMPNVRMNKNIFTLNVKGKEKLEKLDAKFGNMKIKPPPYI